ncbi:sensor histidine kinase [Pleurocapsa sp. PCC 7319]|uniref:sensor histidine kinase n=1 Tax=Pleurocapsa sp. PCC 7319 TaxID=118161 RepID=UPI00034C11D4|nr:sensor histidine kinase [Pleurocapsa sp. PCC 7319]
MKFTNRLKAHPLRLLLYLEWILFIISIMGQFRPSNIPLPPIKLPPLFPEINPDVSPVSILLAIAFLILGLWQPNGKNWVNIVYTGLGFTFIGLIEITDENNIRLLLPLLLIMVIRGCLSFKLPGSIIVAGVSVSWFLVSLYLAVKDSFSRLNIEQVPAIITPGLKPEIIYQLYSNEEQLRALIINMAMSITMLFCLITVFVFLLVNALMSEYRSRQELGLVNQQLREYALLIEDRAMLQERNRIAREIHDSLGHSLTAQNIQLANAILYLRSNLERAEIFLAESKKLSSHALREVRHSVATLRSDPLQGKLLNVAIAELVEDLRYRTEIIFHYQSDITYQLPQEVITTVYRIVQEALTNMIKHSQATEVTISLQLIANYLKVEVQDNGEGFDPQENTTGFGIQGMRERATALGGKFNLFSLPERGCRVTAKIPLIGQF